LFKNRKEAKQLPKQVTVARLGEDVPPFKAFSENATVDEILTAFDEELEKGESLAINGSTVRGADVPSSGEVIYISPSTTGA